MKNFFVKSVARLVAILPFNFVRWLGWQFGRLLYWTRSRHFRTTIKNLDYCHLPELADSQQVIARESCRHTGAMVLESLWIWQRSNQDTLKLVVEVEGEALLKQAISQNNGVILTGPHFGNWELITLWVAQFYETSAIYRAAKLESIDQIIRKGRSKTGAKLITGERKNARKILTALKRNEVFVVLSDQEPEKGSGVYAPFFGRPAYTMTLPAKLIQKTGAALLTFDFKRVKGGFKLTIGPADFASIHQLDELTFCRELNATIEQIIKKDLAQFEWGYKRFKTPPDGDYDFYPE
ncbi:lysophospholipid acyltransferase family protein [Pleionea sediminis]|uniref:lysophospholipid acyltransferase family protein n=1 Tax=Pleionea sediminis TaxID=2569479 RepID=UPI00118517D2|nr:lysophospholipid acyltransferase family protein [Pleionea sediminis]